MNSHTMQWGSRWVYLPRWGHARHGLQCWRSRSSWWAWSWSRRSCCVEQRQFQASLQQFPSKHRLQMVSIPHARPVYICFWLDLSHLKLRLVFPSVQENSSAIAILPHFLEVCGRKLDNVSGVQDWLSIKIIVKWSNAFSAWNLDLICFFHHPYLGQARQAWDPSVSGART